MWRNLYFSFLVLAVALVGGAVNAQDASEQQSSVDKATVTVNQFSVDPDLEWLQKNAPKAMGIMVVPVSGKAGFIIGGSGGVGVYLARDRDGTWSYPAFYQLASLTFGLQIGVEVSEIVMLILSERGRDALLTTDVKLGADISVAAGPVGTGTKAQTADVVAYVKSQGAYAGFNVEGAVVSTKDSWNEKYYGQKVSPLDILIERKVMNAGADALRDAVAKMTMK